ncbi:MULTISPECIES: (Fe-S)-binding protein [Acidithrix]|uniref:Lactate utilization protein A n=1 Tax=Acidithrix ferrooxidans TaxID=1280514 RepID=A0A0D8HEM3_9ACTN|nr:MULTISPECIES: (Fe-S)-binding protein [Acidithrix]ATZ76167.1 L-lactate utilization protein A [uncultured Acidithrix sp.]KJF16363.1 lactate utilization protein A [Acidithrix ferrooxidans]CAG4913683.1 unnamed protein product [Acidithrix sp. C25]
MNSQKIAIFETCLNGALFSRTTQATFNVLTRYGYQVHLPKTQVCCGQMHFNTGYPDLISEMIRSFVKTNIDYDYVVFPSASCAAMVRENYLELAGGFMSPTNVHKLASILNRSFELVEFIDTYHREDVSSSYFPHKVVLHPTCHSVRSLGLLEPSLRILGSVDGIELITNPTQTTCCGFGGTFSVKNNDVSEAMLEDKVNSIISLDAQYLVALDNSCLMHIGGGLKEKGSQIKTLHIAEILASTKESALV